MSATLGCAVILVSQYSQIQLSYQEETAVNRHFCTISPSVKHFPADAISLAV